MRYASAAVSYKRRACANLLLIVGTAGVFTTFSAAAVIESPLRMLSSILARSRTYLAIWSDANGFVMMVSGDDRNE
jgi:fluoride ion exporter CrcB/FEX